jgi:hypothetical protein
MRPTADDLEDVSETGRIGCLLPQIDDAPEFTDDFENDDED